ncbi:MAG: outer membrane beta-barrel protein [Ekhidna sp.]
MRSYLVVLTLLIATTASSQYWFGPKAGISYNRYVYQDKEYRDSYDIDNDLNFQGGVAFAYTATDMFSAYGELNYERLGKTLRDKLTNGTVETVEMTNHFISVPIMFRVTMGKGFLKYYANGGPRLSFWLGGKGESDLQQNDEGAIFGTDPNDSTFSALPYKFKLRFNSSKTGDVESSSGSGLELQNLLVDKPNILQFGLNVGGGFLYDLPNGSRIMIDFRYTWSHSNMAQNSEADGNIYGQESDVDYYRENWEYSRNYASISIGYLLGYNADLKRKGGSTNKESKKKKK